MTPEFADALIVGAGPAGLAAAIELKQRGLQRVIILEREAQQGGMPRLCHHTGFGLWDFHRLYTGPQYARRLVEQAQAAGVEIRTAATVTGWAADRTLFFTSPQGVGSIRGGAVLLATGVRERPRAARLTPGYRPRGVFTTGSLQRFVDEKHLPVGQRAVIIGAEEVSLSAFLTLTGAGLDVAAFLTELPRHQLYFPYTPAKWLLVDAFHRTPIWTFSRVTRILGRLRVEGVETVHLETGERRVIPCDTVVFTGDWIPEYEVARSGGLSLNAGTRGPRADAQFRTSQMGVFAAGNLLRGAETAATSAMEGRQAAFAMCHFLEKGRWPELVIPVEVDSPLRWVYPNALTADTLADDAPLTFRVAKFVKDALIRVVQGEKVLFAQKFSQLRPNKTIRLSSEWFSQVDLNGGAVRLQG